MLFNYGSKQKMRDFSQRLEIFRYWLLIKFSIKIPINGFLNLINLIFNRAKIQFIYLMSSRKREHSYSYLRNLSRKKMELLPKIV